MQPSDFSSLLVKLLPRGDCWQIERDSMFSKLIDALSNEFSNIYLSLEDKKEEPFPKSETFKWKDTLLFTKWQELYTMSLDSINAQLDLHKVNKKMINIVVPAEKAFVLDVHINLFYSQNFQTKGEINKTLKNYKDIKLESILEEILPAYCQKKFIYEYTNEKN